MIKRLFVFSAAVACLALAGLIGWLVGVDFYAGHALRRQSYPILGKAPQYTGLTNQLGQTVNSSQFKGKVQVTTFLDPYCEQYCPLIVAHLVGFEHLLEDSGLQSKVQIVGFDVDRLTGPKQMGAFLKEYGWNPSDLHWQYLTGPPEQIRHIVTDGFHIYYKLVFSKSGSSPSLALGPEQTPQPTVVNPLAQKAKPNFGVVHNDAIVIVDPSGHIRKVYEQADVVSNRRLLKAVKSLLPSAG